jgi:signal transduction histidine kinase
MKGDFVAAASHELRTPLTAIIGSLKTAQRSEVAEDPEMRTEILGAAERQSERLLSLVEDLLAAAHIEEGEGHEPGEPFDIGQLLEELAEPLRQGRPVRVRASSALPPIVANRSHVRQAIRSLLDNAGKFSPPASPVDVTADRRNGEIEVRVIDRGPGIDTAEHERIFDRFHQIDQSSTRRVGGLGLGLHLVRGLARELGGSVDVESDPGSGSTFILRIPLAAPARHDH